MKTLISRADDFGSCEAANRAILQAVEAGAVSCVSVMACGPAFDAERLERISQRAAIGLHVCLNAEWDDVKWRPLSHVAHVPSLLDENGFFVATPANYAENGLDPDEAMAEVALQLAKLRSANVPVFYLDEHMMVSWASTELRARLAQFCRRERLFDAHNVSFLPDVEGSVEPQTPDELAQLWLLRLDAVSGEQVLVTHPCEDAPDSRLLSNAHHAPGTVARERDFERRALLSGTWRDGLTRRDVKLVRFGE